ncbi:MAG: LPXTG cell wall anchor domain-containing protein [Clostridia bacterium]|nr:LPXTG cell wall anchor domain-containing protein [Clostridia bacterium]
MSKIKKIFAVLLTLAMVMGMTMTTFAAGGITVKNATNATLSVAQVIEADSTTATGWKFTTAGWKAFNSVAAYAGKDQQNVIAGLVVYAGTDASKLDASLSPEKITAADMEAALAAVDDSAFASFANGGTLTAPGLYAIKATETGFVYSPMAAYVAFGATSTTEVEAKKAPTTTTKETTDTDKVTEIGKTVSFDVTSSVPYIADGDTNKYYVISDTLTGGTYNVEAEGENAGKLKVSVKVGTAAAVDYFATVTTTATNSSFVLDLSTLVADHSLANQSVVATYSVTTTDVQIGNDVKIGNAINNPSDKFGSDHEDVYSAEIELLKKGEDADADKLAGADFVIYKTLADTTVQYATAANGKLTGWTTAQAATTDVPTTATTFTTDSDGKIKLQGLDVGTYSFKETDAPDGYSVNTTDVSVTVTVNGKASAIVTADPAQMSDTKLTSLPSTGGIGTTIFTIGGCLIMIVAAGLFFASRKKAAK